MVDIPINSDGSCSYAWADFYKASGKWYAGGLVNFVEVRPWDNTDDKLDTLWKNQRILHSATDHKQWTIVLDNPYSVDKNPEHKFLWKQILQIGQ